MMYVLLHCPRTSSLKISSEHSSSGVVLIVSRSSASSSDLHVDFICFAIGSWGCSTERFAITLSVYVCVCVMCECMCLYFFGCACFLSGQGRFLDLVLW